MTNEVYASGLTRPFGIAFFPNGDNPQWVYVANAGNVVRFPYHAGDLKALSQARRRGGKSGAGIGPFHPRHRVHA